jgi:hypothetical protein
MAYCPEVLDPDTQVCLLRRRYPRQTLRSLAYVKLDQTNGGIIRDLTESGMAIQAVAPLRSDQEVHLHFELLLPRVRVDVLGRVAWADSVGQAGIQFLGLAPRSQRTLRDWLLIQMFSAASISGRDSIFAQFGYTQPDQELTFSAALRPAIVVEPQTQATADWESPRVAWGLFSLSASSFSIFVDSLVLLCAVLLFSISSITVMGGLPAWPLAAALFVTVSTIFIAAYQILFSDLLCGATPGKRLAFLATLNSEQEEPAQRFR